MIFKHTVLFFFKNMNLSVKKLDPEAKLPTRATEYDAGYDLYSLSSGSIPSKQKKLIKTGISIRMPTLPNPLKLYASIRSRSGLSFKHSLEVGAGVIDYAYTNEIGVILYNHSDTEFVYDKHDRIAQLVLEVIITPDVQEVEAFEPIEDRNGGFGSTGK